MVGVYLEIFCTIPYWYSVLNIKYKFVYYVCLCGDMEVDFPLQGWRL